MGDSPGSCKSPYFLQDKLAENYYRLCGLITTVCTDLLRDILSRHIKPSDLRFELDINRTKLEKHMTKVQREHFYLKAGSNPISPKDLDISILYMLLRNICSNIPKPKTGWGNPPLIGDNSISACIERIRQVRNKIHAHSTNGRVNDTDFQNYWDELYDSVIETEKELTGGSVYESGMRNLLSMKLSQTDGEKYNYEFHKLKGNVFLMIKQMCVSVVELYKRYRIHNSLLLVCKQGSCHLFIYIGPTHWYSSFSSGLFNLLIFVSVCHICFGYKLDFFSQNVNRPVS